MGSYFATNPKMILINIDQCIIGDIVLAVGFKLKNLTTLVIKVHICIYSVLNTPTYINKSSRNYRKYPYILIHIRALMRE